MAATRCLDSIHCVLARAFDLCFCCCREDQARFRPWHLLCSQLLYVVGEVLRFTTIDVLEPLWGEMEEQLGRAANMDEVGGACFVAVPGGGGAAADGGDSSVIEQRVSCSKQELRAGSPPSKLIINERCS